MFLSLTNELPSDERTFKFVSNPSKNLIQDLGLHPPFTYLNVYRVNVRIEEKLEGVSFCSESSVPFLSLSISSLDLFLSHSPHFSFIAMSCEDVPQLLGLFS